MFRPVFASVLLLALSFCLTSAGSITGTVHFTGSAAPQQITLSGDKACIAANGGATSIPSETVMLNSDHTLRNVFLYVSSGVPARHYQVPADTVLLTQKGCRYSPHVLGLMAGQPMAILNDDATMHNVHAMARNSKAFNLAQPMQGIVSVKTFDKPEIMVRMKCDVHRWMSAYIGVMDHPFFAVSDDHGRFTIPDLPPGIYELTAWHEKFGTRTARVTIGPAGPQHVDFTYGNP